MGNSEDVKIYPNFCNGKFAILNKVNDYILTVTDIIGEFIYKSKINNQKLI
jgi:hypothetical protein